MEYKEDLRVVRTRKLLSNTLLDMMEENSIEKISVIDLCNRAMVNRATFYAHFEDKYHLLTFALEELKDDVYASFTLEFNVTTPRDMLRKLANMALLFVFDKKNHVANIIRNNRNEKVINTVIDSLAQSVRYQLGKFKDSHPSEIPPIIVSVCFASALVNLLVWAIDNNDKYSQEDMVKYMDMIFDEAKI